MERIQLNGGQEHKIMFLFCSGESDNLFNRNANVSSLPGIEFQVLP